MDTAPSHRQTNQTVPAHMRNEQDNGRVEESGVLGKEEEVMLRTEERQNTRRCDIEQGKASVLG